MRSLKTAAPSAPAKETKFDPSTWANQARLLARNDADAAALRVAMILAALVLLALAARLLVDLPLPRDPGVVLAIAIAGCIVIAGVWIWTYASALASNTRRVRSATWQEELARGEDIDHDGVVGPPQPAGHVVRIGGSKPREVVIPDLDPAPWAAPPLVRFPVPANDVIYILSRAAKSGLGFRDWDGHRLPSGNSVDRDLWSRVIDGMVDWEMVQSTTDAAGRRRVRLAGDVTVDEMISAVRQSVAGRQPV